LIAEFLALLVEDVLHFFTRRHLLTNGNAHPILNLGNVGIQPRDTMLKLR